MAGREMIYTDGTETPVSTALASAESRTSRVYSGLFLLTRLSTVKLWGKGFQVAATTTKLYV